MKKSLSPPPSLIPTYSRKKRQPRRGVKGFKFIALGVSLLALVLVSFWLTSNTYNLCTQQSLFSEARQ
jgi:hypothetical protein